MSTSPDCPHRPPCPGCPRFGSVHLPSDAVRALADLAADAGLEPPVALEGEPFGYRHRARLAVRGRAASPKVGVFQEGSHRIVDIPRCLVHHPLVNRVAAAVKDAVRETGTTPYAEGAHRGLLRYVQIVVERASATAQVVLVTNDDAPSSADALAQALRARVGDALHSLWWNGNPTRTNTILGPHWLCWHGPETIEEPIGGARVFFPPGAFGQTNMPLAAAMIERAHAWVVPGSRIVEFHAGCGAVGLGLAARALAITFNEISPAGCDGLARGIAVLDPESAARTTIVRGDAADHVELVDAADVVIVDPPRRGLEPALLERLVERPPARLVTISCSLPAFLREAAVLRASDRMRLAALVPVALFPHTAHVEVLALFEPGGASGGEVEGGG